MLQPPKPGPPPPIHLHTAVRALFSKAIWSRHPPARHPSVAPQCSEAKPWLLQHFGGGAEWSVPMLTHPTNLISPGLRVSHSFPLNDFFFQFLKLLVLFFHCFISACVFSPSFTFLTSCDSHLSGENLPRPHSCQSRPLEVFSQCLQML